MRGVVYCDTCGTSNPGGLKKCQTCNCNLGAVRNNPITSADFANRKMAVFDLDDTILDPEQRFIDARRAGVIDKDGEPKGKDGWKKRGDFLYNEDRLLKDRVMDNSMDLIEHLMEKGYVIAYCTARPFSHYEATKHQLEQKGFPMFQNGVGEDLLFCKRSLGQKTPLYKKGVMETLQAQYDVRLFFDDKPENLAAALQADVPGVYSSVKEYWNMIGVRGNPHTVEDPPPHGFYAPKPYDQDTADANERKNPRSNPPKSKVDKGKELYKHMNGKDPAKTETKTIDIGDVWYQVGEGGCWEIGYMSGKETGSATQKYRHTFNEETKNGDFPKLYATIPDKGKPMLIITGGTWKIKTDEDGVAWIYD